jgi:microcin C transport system substrate-binding protein
LALQIQQKIHDIGAFLPTFMVPYVRQAFWRWWRLPKVPGTKHTNDLFDPFDTSTGGLFWCDQALREETLKAKKKKKKLPPVTIVDTTYRMPFLENSKFSASPAGT